MLLTFGTEDKLRTPEMLDRLICAEIPDKEEHPVLYDIVTKVMIHGPCGTYNTNSPCMDEHGHCSKKFPKQFVQATVMDEAGYPEYRRRIIPGRTAKKGEIEVDSRWVVPYNPYLTQKYNAHINLDLCASVKSIKYIHKYLFKGILNFIFTYWLLFDCHFGLLSPGHDCARLRVQNVDGNQRKYLTMMRSPLTWTRDICVLLKQYTSSASTRFRISPTPSYGCQFIFQMNRLWYSMPETRTKLWNGTDIDFAFTNVSLSTNNMVEYYRAAVKYTMLTAWFELNKADPQAAPFHYHDIPHHYVYHKKTCVWKNRQRGGYKVLRFASTVFLYSEDYHRF